MDIQALIGVTPRADMPNISPGDTVQVSFRTVEGERERVQAFQGVVIRVRRGAGANFTVRRISHGVGVERTFPLLSPRLDKVEVLRHGRVRRAKLYYLRGLSRKAARLKESTRAPAAGMAPPLAEEEPEAEE